VNKKSIFSAALLVLFITLAILMLSIGNTKDSQNFTWTSDIPFYATAELTPVWYSSNSKESPPASHFPEFSLVDQSGKKLSRGDLENKLVVANFFFTYCTNVCPTLTSSMSRVQNAFKDKNNVMLLSHSVTPEFDIAPMLQAYANANNIDGKQWRLLTGTPSELSKIAHEGYFVPKTAVGPSGFIHTELFVLLDGKHRVRGVYNGTLQLEVDLLIKDMKQLLEEKGSATWINKLFDY
jgi:protein SCO1